MITALFWACTLLLGYIYAGYPLIVRVLASRMGRDVARADIRPTVTVVIAAFNEQKNILQKLENVLALDYSPELLDVIVVSDASTDATDQLVRSFPSKRVMLLRVEGRLGKTACQNRAVEQARGEIVVFTDATTHVDRAALLQMVPNFADSEVGCVAGCLVYQGKTVSVVAEGGTGYWGYEIGLRAAESRLSTLIGVSGCLYGVRRAAYRPISPSLISDFVIAMRMRDQGLRTILESGALCYEETLDRSKDELSMRIRVAVRSIAAILSERQRLNPLFDPLFSWQLWSHKLLRYISPFLWLLSLLSCLLLAGHPVYRIILAVQMLVIAAGVGGLILHTRFKNLRILSKPYYFLLTNLASLLAWVRFAKGERVVVWNPLR